VKAKILVVEDERIIASGIKKDLEYMGYTVLDIASSGLQAIDYAGRDMPDLVLMDIVLKGDMDGIEAAHEIINRYNIPIIYLTAYADEEILERAMVTEPYGYLIKPFNDSELKANIEMALYKHKAEEERKEFMKNQLMDDYYQFIVNSIHESNFFSDEEIKKELNETFENSFEEKMRSKFEKELKKRDLDVYDDDTVILFECYLSWVSKLFKEFGIRSRIVREDNSWMLEFYNCPWIDQANKSPLFCINCIAMISRSFKWINLEGKIEGDSKITDGAVKCSYRFSASD
jgi:CheY-like chemotaxis protein/predicted ArsR family transcriptional regulator